MSRSEDRPAGAAPAHPSHPASDGASHISSDMQIIGNLKSVGNVRIEGRVNGEGDARAVDITPGAYIDGAVIAQVVQIGGKVKGRVEAKRVIIQQSGEMFGDVVYEALEVESGSRFEGACKPFGSEPKVEQGVEDSPRVA